MNNINYFSQENEWPIYGVSASQKFKIVFKKQNREK